jgi:hypothetical protein
MDSSESDLAVELAWLLEECEAAELEEELRWSERE